MGDETYLYEGEEDQQLREEEWQQRYLTKEPVNLTQTVSSGVLIDIKGGEKV